MSTIEDRLRRDIATSTGGVVVTESDLLNAREELGDRIDSRKRRDRFRVLAVAAAAAVVIPLVAVGVIRTQGADDPVSPANSGPIAPSMDDSFLKGSPPTPNRLEGIWRIDNGFGLVRFESGTRISAAESGLLFDDPEFDGRYEIDGDTITVNLDGGSLDCAGKTFAMRSSLPGPGLLRSLYTQSAPDGCSPSVVSQSLEQVLPTSASLTGLEFSSLADSKWATPSQRDLFGDWMAEGGGYLLELAESGAYYVANESGNVVDQGQWSGRDAVLTLTSSTDSGHCADGTQLVLQSLEESDTEGTKAIRGTVDRNDCGGAWTPKTWILIP
jgi:hypothetical protein